MLKHRRPLKILALFLLASAPACSDGKTVRLSDRALEILSEPVRTHFERYLSEYPDFKAFAIDAGGRASTGVWGYRRPERAVERALEGCEKTHRRCWLFAIGDQIVLGRSTSEQLTAMADYEAQVFAGIERLPYYATSMTGDEIRALLSPGVAAEFESFQSGTGSATIFPDGRIFASLDKKVSSSPGQDEGHWWLENDRFCRKFDHWFNGRAECQRMVRDGDRFKLFDRDGLLMSKLKNVRPLEDRPPQ